MNLKICILLFSLLFVSTLQRKIRWDSLIPKEIVRNPEHDINERILKSYSEIESRIVGGFEAEAEMFPFQAALTINRSDGIYFCGGSLISKRTILTAAHCADGASGFDVLLGATSLRNETAGELELRTTMSVVHPDWNPNTVENDIALVILNEDVSFSDQISPVTLATRSSQNEKLIFKTAEVSGWGKTSDVDRMISSNLRYTNVTTIPSGVCRLYFGQFPRNAICVSGFLLKGSCSADSGGPLTINKIQVGIVSFGGASCQAGFPYGYTDVSAYIDFIEENSDYKE